MEAVPYLVAPVRDNGAVWGATDFNLMLNAKLCSAI